MKTVKNEKIVNNNNRIYVALDNTEFNVGDKYNYLYDKKNKELVIQKSETGNTVSKKRSGKKIKPLIDIRNKAVLKEFQDFEQLKIEVLESKVIVTGYKQKIVSKIVSNVLSFTKIRAQYEAKMQEAFQLSLDLDFVEQAVGDSIVSSNSEVFNNLPKEAQYALKVVSLFSGAGFSDYGLSQAEHEGLKFELTKAYDYDKYACETYAHNLGAHIEQQDITKLDLSTIPSADVMVCTPSCFGFTNANRSSNMERKKEQNDLTKYAVDAIKANKQCKFFIMENAPQLLTSEGGAYLRYILDELSDFEISYGVLDAAYFGAPQHRKRAFLIGSKLGKIELPKPTHNEKTFKTVGQALFGLDFPSAKDLPNYSDYTKPSDIVEERMSYIPHGGNIKDIPAEIRPKGQMSNAYRRLHPDQPSISIVNYRKSNITPPYANRTLTVREACRLMGVPDTFEIKGTLGAKQQQTCNGVVPAVMKAVGEQVLKAYQTFLKMNNISLFPQFGNC